MRIKIKVGRENKERIKVGVEVLNFEDVAKRMERYENVIVEEDTVFYVRNCKIRIIEKVREFEFENIVDLKIIEYLIRLYLINQNREEEVINSVKAYYNENKILDYTYNSNDEVEIITYKNYSFGKRWVIVENMNAENILQELIKIFEEAREFVDEVNNKIKNDIAEEIIEL